MEHKTIRKEGDTYSVYSEAGKRLGGPYKTREEAEKRLAQVEYFKHGGKPKGFGAMDYKMIDPGRQDRETKADKSDLPSQNDLYTAQDHARKAEHHNSQKDDKNLPPDVRKAHEALADHHTSEARKLMGHKR